MAAAENSVLLVQRWIPARLRDQTFFELSALNRAIRVLLDALNDRPLKNALRPRALEALPASTSTIRSSSTATPTACPKFRGGVSVPA